MTETQCCEAARTASRGGHVRALAPRGRQLLGLLALVLVAVLSGVLPASAMRIRPLHDRVLVAPTLVAAMNSQGIVVVFVFTLVVEVDPHGVPHGVMRIDPGDGQPMVYEPIEASVARDVDQQAAELLIFVTPRIVKPPADASMAHVHRDPVDPGLLHWTVIDPDGNYLMFSTPGVMETLPPAGGPLIRR